MKHKEELRGYRVSQESRIDFSPTMQWVRLNNVAEAQEPPQEFWQDVESLKQTNRPGELEVTRMRKLMERYGLLH